MNNVTKLVSLVGLLATVVPCLLYWAGILGHDTVKLAALLGTIVWFAATPFWMGRTPEVDDSEVQI